jgi:hypothetical protein
MSQTFTERVAGNHTGADLLRWLVVGIAAVILATGLFVLGRWTAPSAEHAAEASRPAAESGDRRRPTTRFPSEASGVGGSRFGHLAAHRLHLLADGREALVTAGVETDGGQLAALLEVAIAPRPLTSDESIA